MSAWAALAILSLSILFVAGVIAGVSICLELTLGEQAASLHSRGVSGEGLIIVAVCFLLTAAPLALADPAPEANDPCPASTQEQARWLGDVLFEQGAFRRAGECYEAAGDHALANRAFLKAVAPESAATARRLSDQQDQAKELLRKVQRAFR